jgi:hypothetical protein
VTKAATYQRRLRSHKRRHMTRSECARGEGGTTGKSEGQINFYRLRGGPTKVKGLNLNLGVSCPPTPDLSAPLLPASILPPPDRHPRLQAAVLTRATIDVSGRQILGSPTPRPPSKSQAATSSGPRRLTTTPPGRPPPLATTSHCLAQSSTAAAKPALVDDRPASPPVISARAALARVPA